MVDKRELLEYWRSLLPLSCDELIGIWKGDAWRTGSLFVTLLLELSWFGKVFRAPEDVDALVFSRPRTRIGLFIRWSISLRPLPEDPRLLRHPLGKARLEHRTLFGVRSAAMRYRYLPVIDHFRRIDEASVMGLMEVCGRRKPELFFRLRKREGHFSWK